MKHNANEDFEKWLEENGEDFSSTKPKNESRETFPCIRCGGTGKYRGIRVHQKENKCFTCGGKGHFLTSEKDRRRAKQHRVNKKAETEKKLLENFINESDANKGIVEFLSSKKDSNFASSLIGGIKKWGSLTEKQKTAVFSWIAKEEDNAKNRATPAAKLDLSKIKEKFDDAREKGIKRCALRIIGFKFTRASDTGRNAGYIYIKDTDNGDLYLGKVSPNGEFFKSYDCKQEHIDGLLKANENIFASARLYGQKTGRCTICGRELTNKRSIELGIGMICQEKWGWEGDLGLLPLLKAKGVI